MKIKISLWTRIKRLTILCWCDIIGDNQLKQEYIKQFYHENLVAGATELLSRMSKKLPELPNPYKYFGDIK